MTTKKTKIDSDRRVNEKKIINIRVTDEELAIIKERADKYANGNLSVYLRHVAMNFKPKSS